MRVAQTQHDWCPIRRGDLDRDAHERRWCEETPGWRVDGHMTRVMCL